MQADIMAIPGLKRRIAKTDGLVDHSVTLILLDHIHLSLLLYQSPYINPWLIWVLNFHQIPLGDISM